MNTIHKFVIGAGLVFTMLCMTMIPIFAQDPPQPIEPEQVVSGELTSGNRVNYSIVAQQGDVLNVSMTSEDFDAYLYLENTDGERLTFNDDGPDMGLNALIRGFVIPEDGTYIIQAASFGDQGEGVFILRAEFVGLTALEVGETITTNFNTDVNEFVYAFEGVAGQIIDVIADSGGLLDTRMEILSPFGFPAFTIDDGENTVDPQLEAITLDSNGTYLIILSSSDPREVLTGPVDLTVRSATLNSLDEDTLTFNFGLDVNQQVATFTGVAGEIVQLTITVEAGVENTLPIFQVIQDGLTFASFTINSLDEVTVGFVVPEDGLVTVIAQAFSDMTMTISLERVTEEE